MIEPLLADYVAGLDLEVLGRRYHQDEGLLVLPQLLPPSLCAQMVTEARRLLPGAVRKWVPGVRQAGAISHQEIVAAAPTLHAVHQSPTLLALFSQLSGIELGHRQADEPHASALYTYTQPGDFMSWHFDDCGLRPGDSFSTIIGLVDRSASRLELMAGGDLPDRPRLRRQLKTEPGSIAFFCGSRVYHRVTPLVAGEERISFSFTYLRQGRQPRGSEAFRLKLGNSLLYFGGWGGRAPSLK
jgi:hypothetical protein